MSSSQWWVVADSAPGEGGWHRLRVVEPRGQVVYSLYASHLGIEAVRRGTAVRVRYRDARAALRAFRRPSPRDRVLIEALTARAG